MKFSPSLLIRCKCGSSTFRIYAEPHNTFYIQCTEECGYAQIKVEWKKATQSLFLK